MNLQPSSAKTESGPASLARASLVLATFLGSFLLFGLEPLTGKIVTPRFGGTAAVWSTCLFFFQFAVLCGYGLTYMLSRLKATRNLLAFSGLALVSLFWVRLPCPDEWVVAGEIAPVWQLLWLLLKNVGFPSLILSSISGTMQVWYRNASLGDPYPLYSISNVGSLLALIAYPVLLEPNLTVGSTQSFWSTGYALLAGIICLGGFLLRQRSAGYDRISVEGQDPRSPDVPSARPELSHSGSPEPPATPERLGKIALVRGSAIWISLSLLGSMVLLTHTAYITSDIAPVPLLWIAPLAIYLVTFVLAFASPRLYRPFLCAFSWSVALLGEMCLGDRFLEARLGLSLVGMFFLCMLCHGELAAAKPPVRHLPLFWLCTAFGGVLGGLVVSVAAPLLFEIDYERQGTYLVMIIVTIIVVIKRRLYPFGYAPLMLSWTAWTSMTLMAMLVGEVLRTEDILHRERNFYGCVQVKKYSQRRGLVNGQIMHGEQILDPKYSMIPISYYGLPVAFLDRYLRFKSHGQPVSYGCVGLGVGTMAAYGQQGDMIDFFEVDPKIVRIARKFFTYLSDSRARVNVLLGDGRTTMQRLDQARKYDLILIDAFNGDAIPLHLLTVEAMRIYLDHLKPDGILLFHLSNRYIDLVPPVATSATNVGLKSLLLTDDESTTYLITTRKDEVLNELKAGREKAAVEALELKQVTTPAKAWTDNFADMASWFRFRDQ